jgi:hypothetical protein
MKTVCRNNLNGHSTKKTRLQFSKSGDPSIETAYATHFVKPKGSAEQA